MINKMKNSGGFTIMENVVTIAVATVIALALVGGLTAYRKMSQTVLVMNSTDKEVNDIGENIRSNLDSFQVNYNYNLLEKEKALALDNLPMAWDIGMSMPKEQCVTCSGRYGFIIQPYEEFRGLYVVTLRLTHTSWSESFRDYQFVVSAK